MKNTYTLLYLITSTNAGGSEKALFELISRIDRTTCRVYVCSLKKPGLFAQRIAGHADGFYTLDLPETGGMRAVVNFLPALIQLFKLLKKLRPHILHCFLFRANILGRLAGRLAGVPLIISSLRVLEAHKKYKHLIDRLTSSMVNKYIAVSEAVRLFTIRQVHLSPDKIVTIYNGIALEPAVQDKPCSFTADKNLTSILLAGRFEQQKGHAVLIHALTHLLPRAQNIKAYFFGEGPDEACIKDMVKREGISDAVVFMGVVEDILPYMQQMDIVVLPSLWEGLPNVLLEAMAAGRPVVASRIDGVAEVVIDGRTGLLFEPGNAEALAEALRSLIRNKELAEAMGRAGRERVKIKFSLEKNLQETMALYQTMLRGHSSLSPARAAIKTRK
ncbi:MAG: glycosyltransferase family 4 protein [Pseudomonadota bacterium]